MCLLIFLAMGAVISVPFIFVEWNPTVLSYVSMEFVCYTWIVSVVVIGNRILHALETIHWEEIWPEPKYVPHPGCEYRRISPKPPRVEPPRKMKIVEFQPGRLSCVGVEFYCHEDASNLGKKLRKRQMNVLTSHKAGMNGKSDREQLLRAQRDRRILITHRRREFRELAGEIPHCGILLCPPGPEFEQETIRICYQLMDGATTT